MSYDYEDRLDRKHKEKDRRDARRKKRPFQDTPDEKFI